MGAERHLTLATAEVPDPTPNDRTVVDHVRRSPTLTPPPTAVAKIDLSVLDVACLSYKQHRRTATQGEWQESPLEAEDSDDPILALTEMRQLGAGDVVEGLGAAENARLTNTGYRHLSDGLRGAKPVETTGPTRIGLASQMRFGSGLAFKTLTPASDRRLEFGALVVPLGMSHEVPHELVDVHIGGLPAFVLVEAPHLDESDDTVAVLRSKSRLAFSESAKRKITARWDREFATTALTVVGPGADFVAAILLPDSLTQLFNNIELARIENQNVRRI